MILSLTSHGMKGDALAVLDLPQLHAGVRWTTILTSGPSRLSSGRDNRRSMR